MARASASDRSPSNARWYDGVAGLKQLEDDWRGLTLGAELFARYEWHLAAAMHLVGEGRSIKFCRICDSADRPVSIIPAVTGFAPIRPFGQIPALALGWDNQLAAFDFPMAPEADPLQVGRAMLRAFGRHPFLWQVIAWPRVMANSNAAKVALALGRKWTDITPGTVCHIFYTGSHPCFDPDVEVYVVKSSKLRSKLAYNTRRLSAQGQIELRMAREQGKIEEYFEEFLKLEASGWKGAHGTSTAISLVPSAKAFYSSLLAQSNQAFEADIALLFCGEKAVAGQFLLRTARCEYLYKIAYDEVFAALSPGQLMHQQVIEHAKASEAIDWVSWVSGTSWQKEWGPIAQQTLHVDIFRSIWRSAVVHLGRQILADVRGMRSRFSGAPVTNGEGTNPKHPT